MAKMYCQYVGVVLIVLALVGFVRPNPLGFPIGGSAIWIHLISGVILAYLGFTGTSVVTGAQVFGVIYTLVGVLGLIGGSRIPILGAPTTLAYNLVHLAIGVLGLWAGFGKETVRA